MNVERISSNTSLCSPRKYDVFVSFRGEDTHKNFVDHLYAALNQKGIFAFRDDKELGRGKAISPELCKVIEKSRFSIVVFSRNYASSTWCLDELVKIVECMNTLGQSVLPIFYDVDPSVVRNQTGPFQKPFVKHTKALGENVEKVQKWRNALIEVANLSGWDVKDRHELIFIQDIVKEISSNLNPTRSINIMNLVGMNSRLEKLKKLISMGPDDVRMIGICGMGGIGKTTIARMLYESISCEFERSFFLANVREISEKSGLVSLQKQLLLRTLKGRYGSVNNVYDGICELQRTLQHKKVLIVVDDVVNVQQLEALVGKSSWFGLGSRIIITARDKHLLNMHGVDEIYEVRELNHDEALQLLILKAFKNQQPLKDYMELCKRVVEYVIGLPLALEVLGSFLFGKTIDEWEDALARLERDLEKGIFESLRISFDGLNETEKKIFLDIACFFKGKNKDYVTRILEGCGLNPIIGIKILVDKSLIIVSEYNTLWMHDLLQKMGQQVIKRESYNEPGKRSRLWQEADVHHVLTKNTGSKTVEGIMLDALKEQVHCSSKAFSKMTNLRLLRIHNIQLPKGIDYLSNELRLLDWDGYPLSYLPSNSKLDKIVELKLNHSHIKQLWKGTEVFNTLTSINCQDCQYLNGTPDFTGTPNLKEVVLKGCIRLHEIHPSLLLHRRITYLNLAWCTSLTTLPRMIHMESLRKLELSHCLKLKHFPDIAESMECLTKIDLSSTAIKKLPLSIGLLIRLESLLLVNCKKLVSLPITINGLKSLRTLYLLGCSRPENLPDTLGKVESLMMLDLSGTAIRQPMPSIFLLKKLDVLNFRGCNGQSVSNLLSSLVSMMNVMSIRSLDSKAFRLPSLSGFSSSLRTLSLGNCNLDEEAIPSDFFDSFSSLRWLDLSNNSFVSLPRSIDCLSELEYLNVSGCTSLETLSNALRLCNLKLSEISCVNCLKLKGCNKMPFSILKEHIKKVTKLERMVAFRNERSWQVLTKESGRKL